MLEQAKLSLAPMPSKLEALTPRLLTRGGDSALFDPQSLVAQALAAPYISA